MGSRVEWKHKDLGHLPRGSVVRVNIVKGHGPNIRLFDSSNYQSFASGRTANGIQVRAKLRKVDIPVPRDARWHLVVDFIGLVGQAEFNYVVLPAA